MTTIRLSALASGLNLVTQVMPGVKSAAIAWLVPAGLASEPADRAGIASMWAELLMRGAGPLDSRAQADAFDRLGASRGCTPGTYHQTLSATMIGTRLPEVLPLLIDMILAPRFEPESIEPARDLALQALESLKDDPSQRAAIAAKARHYPAPLNRSQLGSEAGLRAITRDDLALGWQARTHPAHSILAVAGAIDPDAIAHQINSITGRWASQSLPIAQGPAPARGYEHLQDESNQVQIFILHDAPPEPHHESLLEKLIINVLSGGMAGRLFTEVREKRGLCYSVNAGYAGSRDFGTVQAYVGTTPQRAQESLDVLLAELARINTGDVTPEEFDRARIGMKSRLVFAGESTAARAAALASDVFRLGKPRSLDDHARAIDQVTLDQLNAYARRRSLGRLTIQTLGPAPLTPPDSKA
jgi:predicted Zn-dependent peptidase